MATMFPQTLGGGEYVDPYAAAIEAARAKLAQPQAPAFTAEQQAQRVAQNQREYELGMLGQLSGDEGLSGVGGQVLRQAIAARSPRVTEKGVADPLRGTFSYSPDYLRERDEAGLAGLEQRSAGARGQFDLARSAAAERATLAAQRAQDQRELRVLMSANRPEPLVAVIGPDGQSVLIPRSQAQGMRPAPTGGGGTPNGEERGAAGFLAMMRNASQALGQHEKGGLPTVKTQALGAIPMVGGFAQRTAQTSAQQLYSQAQEQWVRAKLRKESGASIGKEEMAQEIATFFPQPEDLPERIAQKAQARAVAEQSMLLAAGRAAAQTPGGGATGGWGAGGADDSDPLGLRRANPSAR